MRYTLSILKPAPIRKRLWQGGVGMFVLLGTLVVGNFFISPDRAVDSRMLGHDFLAFYTAGTFARTGQFDKLYNLDAVRDSEQAMAKQNNLEIGKSFGPYWNPPFYAWIFAPLSALPYRPALLTWTLINVTCLTGAILLMCRMLAPQFLQDRWNWGLIPLLICISMPFVQAISHGQNTFTSLLLLSLLVTFWRKQKPILAGVFCGLMFYKPQLAAIVAAMLILSLGLRVLIGLGVVGLVLASVSVFTMPHTIADYLHQLPLNLRYMQIDRAYLWERHATLKAFWRLLFQGRDAGETALTVTLLTTVSCLTIGVGLIGSWWRNRTRAEDDCWAGDTKAMSRDRLIGATIVCMPLLMPFYFDYDLLLLSVPAVLLAGEVLARAPGAPMDRFQRLLIGVWIALYVWLMVNPPIAGASGVNVTVVFLSTIAVLSIVRAAKLGAQYSPVEISHQPLNIPIRRAA